MSIVPCFPNLRPRAVEILWYFPDKGRNEVIEVDQLEAEQQSWSNGLKSRYSDDVPIGTPVECQPVEEENDEEEEEEEDEEEEELGETDESNNDGSATGISDNGNQNIEANANDNLINRLRDFDN